MRPFGVVINSPSLDEFFRIFEIDEPVLIEALVAHRPVEAFNEGVLDRLTRLDELLFDAMLVGPPVEHFARELGTIVSKDPRRMSPLGCDTIYTVKSE